MLQVEQAEDEVRLISLRNHERIGEIQLEVQAFAISDLDFPHESEVICIDARDANNLDKLDRVIEFSIPARAFDRDLGNDCFLLSVLGLFHFLCFSVLVFEYII